MDDQHDNRVVAVERLDRARDQRATAAREFEAADGSARELPAFAKLEDAEEQFAAREAWLKWIDGGY
jgi:hypothetical protein